MPKIHKLKCWAHYYEAVRLGDKKFDVRRDDRDYETGDYVLLEKYDHEHGCYVVDPMDGIPYAIEKRIAYILQGGQFGIEPGYVVLGF